MIPRCVLCAAVLWAATSTAGFPDNEVDVLNRPVAPLLARGRPVLVLYCNRSMGWVGDSATNLAVRLRDVPFTTLVHVDLRGIPGVFHGYAEHSIRRRQEQGVERFRNEFLALGLTPPSDAADRLILVADPHGAPHQAAGLPEGFKEPLAVVLNPAGNEVMRGFLPRDEQRIERAIRESAHD